MSKWIKIAKEESKIIKTFSVNEDQLGEAITWLEKEWVQGLDLGIEMATNESGNYHLFLKGDYKDVEEGKNITFEDGPLDYSQKQEFLDNLREAIQEGK